MFSENIYKHGDVVLKCIGMAVWVTVAKCYR